MKSVNKLIFTNKYGMVRLMRMDREFVIALKEDNKTYTDSDLLTLTYKDLESCVLQPTPKIDFIDHDKNKLVCIPKRLSLKVLLKERNRRKGNLIDQWENGEYWVLLIKRNV